MFFSPLTKFFLLILSIYINNYPGESSQGVIEIGAGLIAFYFGLALLYFVFRPGNSGDTANAMKLKKLTSKGLNLGIKMGSSVAGVMIGQIQIIKIIISQISWDPGVPSWLIDIVESLGSMFSVNLPSLMSSPECITEMEPLGKWVTKLAFPLFFVVVFILWYVCAKCYFKSTKIYDPKVVQTILAGAVNVLLIGKFIYFV